MENYNMIYAAFKLSNLFNKVQTKRIKGNMQDYPKKRLKGMIYQQEQQQ